MERRGSQVEVVVVVLERAKLREREEAGEQEVAEQEEHQLRDRRTLIVIVQAPLADGVWQIDLILREFGTHRFQIRPQTAHSASALHPVTG